MLVAEVPRLHTVERLRSEVVDATTLLRHLTELEVTNVQNLPERQSMAQDMPTVLRSA